MRERGRKNRTSATMLAGWKKAVVLMLALIVCISSVVVPQPEEVSAKQAAAIGNAVFVFNLIFHLMFSPFLLFPVRN